MKIKDIVNLTRNRANNQISFNLKARKLYKLGITPEHLLQIKLPKNFKLIKDNQKNQNLKNNSVKIELKGGIKNDY